MNNLVRDGGSQEWTNGTGSAVSAGGVVNLTDRIGIAAVDIANGATGTVYTKGVYKLLKKAATAFVAGADVDWDVSESQCDELGVGVAGDILHIGKCVKAPATSATYMEVEINIPVTCTVVA